MKRLFYKQEKKAIFLPKQKKKHEKKQKQKQKQTWKPFRLQRVKWYRSRNPKWALWSIFWGQIKLENKKNEIDEKKNKSNYPTKQPSCLLCVEQFDSRLKFYDDSMYSVRNNI